MLQKEPLRLWYRIGCALDEVKVEPVKVAESARAKVKEDKHMEELKESKKSKELKELKELKEVKEVKVTRDTLVDITDRYGKRGGWSTNQKASPKMKTTPKRRKRMSVKPEPVDVSPEKVKMKDQVPEPVAPEPLAEEVMFDSSHPAEFCCSTPIPALAQHNATESGDEVEPSVKNWLPKAVFDLDDKALFAKRLLRETAEPSGRKLSQETHWVDQDDPKATPPTPQKHESNPQEKDENDALMKPDRDVSEPSERLPAGSPEDSLMNPLRICVSPDGEVHDSIGALDLSGRSDSTDTSPRSGSLPAAAPVSASPGRNCSGPHPYFMTPSALYTSLELLKRPALVSSKADASGRKHPPGSQLCWDDWFSPASVQPAHQPSTHHFLNFNKYK